MVDPEEALNSMLIERKTLKQEVDTAYKTHLDASHLYNQRKTRLANVEIDIARFIEKNFSDIHKEMRQL